MILFILSIILLLAILVRVSYEGFTSDFKYGGVKTEFVPIKNTMPSIINADDKILIPNSYTYSLGESIDGADTKEPDRTTTDISEYHMLKKRLI